MGKCLKLTDDNFEMEVMESAVPVLVKFWGSWCAPCKMMEPVIAKVAKELDGSVKVGKLNVDCNPATRARFNISAAPTMILFRDSEIAGRVIGAHSSKQLLQFVEDGLGVLRPRREIKAVEAGGRTPQSKGQIEEAVR
jgi:thioredoxin 1